ncbi:MAG: hypothetical protein IT215_02870 [Chitinophagaceae bacterium]|nr:MAG: Ribonuclease Y [Bacteroidetes bacterium OLB11]MCC6447607.1 hypothetical protein [Chitinophagaceae bacterium]HMN32421.1 hypothetical protein [Chitinophagaceae bacterium]
MANQNQENRKGISLHWIYSGIIALLVFAGGYLFMDRNKALNTNETLTSVNEIVKSEKADLEADYNAALARLDEMKNQSVQMDSLLSTKNDEIAELRRKIDNIVKNKNATDAELKEASKFINELKSKLNTYQEQIKALKSENIQLTEEKRQLIQDKNQLTQESEKLQIEKTDLEKKVDLGSVLHASGFKLETINNKKNFLGKEKEVTTQKAKKVDLIRISFDIDDNRISESGDKILYILIKTPNGKVVSTPGNIFKLTDGSEMNYTVSKIIPYTKGEKTFGVKTEWRPNETFEIGTYNVEVYHQGYKIGNEAVNLK